MGARQFLRHFFGTLVALMTLVVAYDVYEPDPTMKFPGIEEF
jgi:hypothetical protein